ncbi:MAG: hypothetical protein ACE5LX_09315, partial [Nitrospinota bacterium]
MAKGRPTKTKGRVEVPEALRVRIRAPRGCELSCKGWGQEAALRMLMTVLDGEVAENPDE